MKFLTGGTNPERTDMTVQGELVEPHGTHEGDVRQLIVEQLLILHNPQSSQTLEEEDITWTSV